MAFRDGNHTIPEHSPDVEQATEVDSERSPQLDLVKCRCRCGCACNSSRPNDELTEEGGGAEFEDEMSVDGEEGADKETEFGDMGSMTPLVVRLILARHQRCTCSDTPRPYACCRTMSSDDHPTPGGSMLVRLSPSQRTMSTVSLLSQSSNDEMSLHSSGIIYQAGTQFEQGEAQSVPEYHFVRTPLRVVPEPEFPFMFEITVHYPDELEIETGATHDFPMYDLW
ncbi:hypothetical protein LTR78_004553 [Recurvomyces mirabilis]|uniref:Uncharacterized protein n=1 Tax=Recurvomyces mirabilis TaxID=574656 RepID=A0AAE0WPL3_9PEZI|nr:hypothetical protein LTR78_004553 [Recurvomyces mirabilis]KAK5152953.1 hypothetical protein LTS14_008061 [Recurvomyces mirabilis]